MNTQTITIEQLETLATELETDVEAQRSRLSRLCRAYVRIIAAREPDAFEARATRHGDEAGHYDSSYPPKQVYSELTGPACILLASRETEDVRDEGSSGYYYHWHRVTTYGGLYVDMHGRWIRGDETGTGRVGPFAAHPGDCGVDCTIEWSRVGDDDVTLAELVAAERTLRDLAFPLVAAVRS